MCEGLVCAKPTVSYSLWLCDAKTLVTVEGTAWGMEDTLGRNLKGHQQQKTRESYKTFWLLVTAPKHMYLSSLLAHRFLQMSKLQKWNFKFRIRLIINLVTGMRTFFRFHKELIDTKMYWSNDITNTLRGSFLHTLYRSLNSLQQKRLWTLK